MRQLVCAGIVVAGLAGGVWATRGVWRGEYFLLHSTSALGRQYAVELRSPAALPAGGPAVDAAGLREVARLFTDFYVVKDGATDCSFVAALMLVLRRDPAYPLRILWTRPDGYAVQFPGATGTAIVTGEDLRVYHENWARTRERYRRFWGGHLPEGLEILRCAYYNHQAQAGIRGTRGVVHGGGIPARDLLALSGAPGSVSLVAHCEPAQDDTTFASCPTLLLESRLLPHETLATTATLPRPGEDDPIEFLESRRDSLALLSSARSVPRWTGPRLIANHVYYYLGRSPDGGHVLGNSYQTRRPVVVTSDELRTHFRAIDTVDLPGSPQR